MSSCEPTSTEKKYGGVHIRIQKYDDVAPLNLTHFLDILTSTNIPLDKLFIIITSISKDETLDQWWDKVGTADPASTHYWSNVLSNDTDN